LNTLCKNKEEHRTYNEKKASNNETDRFSIGTNITKYWNGVLYKGTVVNNTGKYYNIQYEDTDEEELNHTE
jgi:hypothetical protein